MRNFFHRSSLFLSISIILLAASISISAQTVSFNYYYHFEPSRATVPPQLGGLEVEFPEQARKNGVEGTVTAALTLGEDGKVRDIRVTQDLPFGIGDAVVKGLQKWYFKPAAIGNKPVELKMSVDYVVSLLYGEDDKSVTKPQITLRPVAEYPAKYLADRIKGKVFVKVLFMTDGTHKVVGLTSVMPKEFDRSAQAAAAKIQFQPAMHKKSKKPVSQEMTVEFDFKP